MRTIASAVLPAPAPSSCSRRTLSALSVSWFCPWIASLPFVTVSHPACGVTMLVMLPAGAAMAPAFTALAATVTSAGEPPLFTAAAVVTHWLFVWPGTPAMAPAASVVLAARCTVSVTLPFVAGWRSVPVSWASASSWAYCARFGSRLL